MSRVDVLAQATISKSTASYSSGFKFYTNWMVSQGREAFLLDPGVEDIRMFIALFRRHDTAQAYLTHIRHEIVRSGRTQDCLHSPPVNQALKGLQKKMEDEGVTKKEKPFFSLANVIAIVLFLSVGEVPAALMVLLCYCFAFRLANECAPLRWGVRREQSNGPLKRGGKRWEAGNFIHIANNVEGKLVAYVDFQSRKNAQGGCIAARMCCCKGEESTRPYDQATFARDCKGRNPMCVVHFLCFYYSLYPFRTGHGYPLFPSNKVQKEVETRKLTEAGFACWPKKSPTHQPCNSFAVLTLVRHYVTRQIAFFENVHTISRVTAHIFRRSLAHSLLESGAPFGEMLVAGGWASGPSVKHYVPFESVQEKAVFGLLEETSDDEEIVTHFPVIDGKEVPFWIPPLVKHIASEESLSVTDTEAASLAVAVGIIAPAAVAAAKPARFCDDARITMAERFSLAKTARDLANPTVVGPIPNQSAPNKSRPKRGRPLGSKNKPVSSGPRSPPKKSLRDAE